MRSISTRQAVIVGGLFWALSTGFALAEYANGSKDDEFYRAAFIGIWKQIDIGHEKILERKFSFYSDGTYRVLAKFTTRAEIAQHENQGEWTVENGIVYITVLSSTNSNIPIGRKTPNKIISVTNTEIITASPEGIKTAIYRIQ